MSSIPLYSVGTWDMDAQAYTPQVGLSVPSVNIDVRQLRRAMKELREMGYSCWRTRNARGDHDSDWSVLIERTDGEPEPVILERWRR